jgi:hypothetical protein
MKVARDLEQSRQRNGLQVPQLLAMVMNMGLTYAKSTAHSRLITFNGQRLSICELWTMLSKFFIFN